MKKRIVLCADDYGQALAISQGIINLVELKRLSAVSCLTTSPHWPEHAEWLKPYVNDIDVGLHFNLTDGKMPLSHLMLKAGLRQLSPEAIYAELNLQIDAFDGAMGCLPRFLDGHQHVHQFPVIRDVVVQVYKERLKQSNAYIRLVKTTFHPGDTMANLKKAVVHSMGVEKFAKLLKEHQIPHNSTFNGMYSFSDANAFGRIFFQMLTMSADGALIMCHPGLDSIDKNDPIAKARFAEYQYFTSRHFLADCAASNLEIAPFMAREAEPV